MVSIDDLKKKLAEIEMYKKDIELYEKKIDGAFETIELGMSMTKQMLAAQNNRIDGLKAMIQKFIQHQKSERPNTERWTKKLHSIANEKIIHNENMSLKA